MFLCLFLVFDLYFLIPAAIAKICNSIAELIIPIGIPIKKVKSEIEKHPVTVKAKIRKCLISFRVVKTFSCFFYSSIHFNLFLQLNNFMFHLYFSI